MGGFANWFRYELLYREGGIWVDADMVCLRPFDFGQRRVFAREDDEAINVAVLGLPEGDTLARWMARLCERPNTIAPYDSVKRRVEKLTRRYLEGDERGNVQFGEYGPRGFTEALEYFGLASDALSPAAFYPIHHLDWKQIFEPHLDLSDSLRDSYGIHLWNERMRMDPDFDKDGVHADGCLFESLWRELVKDPSSSAGQRSGRTLLNRRVRSTPGLDV